ncbi:MAG: filamentous hemagglutinin N-terminal domain-containing protein, partial [Scytonema sp. RU_4_4]|nr:filamentous hemagglutinin N-terminal domain-containing protein [Scytonema sp. RU_4_4]
ALGNANLFLLNPAGIVFGPNAQLNIGGSFLGSTANSFIFDNGFEFSATDLLSPPLLTINIPIGLRFRDNPGSITTQSTTTQYPTLEVPSGKTLALVGGNVSLDGPFLLAPGGRIELGGLSVAGTVGLNSDVSLSFPVGVQRADVSLTNEAEVNVSSGGGGSIAVNVRNLDISGGSILRAGIGQGLGSVGSQAGDITLNATGEIKVVGESYIFNNVRSQATGNGGNIDITTGSFSLSDGAQLTASTYGQGNAGSVSVQADSISLNYGDIFSNVERGGEGKGGNININAASLSLKDGAQLQTLVRGASDTQSAGKGDAGNVTVNVTGPVTIAGVKNEFPSKISSEVETGATGNGGNISISSGSFSLSDDARLRASTSGEGNAGSVSVQASDSVELANGDIFSTVQAGAVGNGGNININAASVSLKESAQLTASTFGQGNAGSVSIQASDSVELVDANIFSTVGAGAVGNGGNININAASVSLKEGAQLITGVYGASSTQQAGRGDAGNVTIDVKESVTITGVGSAIFSDVETGVVGNGGNITISSGSFSLTDGGRLVASTSGQGDAGNVSVRASGSVELANTAGILSTVEAGGVGNGGNIDINAASLSLKDGAQLITGVYKASSTQQAGRGDAGNVTVDVTGKVTIAGVKDTYRSAIFSDVETGVIGNGGNITISSGSFSLSDGGRLVASTSGQGDAGNVSVRADDSVELVNGSIFSTVGSTGVGRGGNIDIKATSVSFKDGARLRTSTFGQGNAGNVSVQADDSVSLVNGYISSTAGSIDSTPEQNSLVKGNGGNISITTGELSLTNAAQLATITYGEGDAGDVIIDAKQRVVLKGTNSLNNNLTAVLATVGDVDYPYPEQNRIVKGNGGSISITTGEFLLTDGAQLDASTNGQGNAGRVSVRANSVSLAGNNTGIFSAVERTGVGNAGGIDINASTVSLKDGSQITTSSSGDGAAGDIEVIARSIRLYNGSTISADTVGGQGNINLNARDFVLLRRGSKITTNATGTATGGNITINTNNLVAFPEENSDITAKSDESFGGRISINTKGGIFGIEYREQETEFSDITASSALGPQFSGTVQLNTPDINPSQGLFEFPETVIDPAQQIAQNPCLRGGGEFTIVGRGGFPSNPNQILSSDNVRVDLVKPVASTTRNSTSTTKSQPSTSATDKPIVPARGWIFNEKGEVTLVSYDPTETGVQRSSPTPASCAAPR